MRIRATTKLRNDLLIKYREDHGLNQTKFAKLCGVGLHDIFNFERMNFKSIKDAEEKSLKISAKTGIDAEKIMPLGMEEVEATTTQIQVKDVDPNFLLGMRDRTDQRLISESPDVVAENNEVTEAIQNAMSSLTHREREIIQLRYGLNGNDQLTYNELGKAFKLTGDRVRQIEMKALRTLQHPTRIRGIAETLDDKFIDEYKKEEIRDTLNMLGQKRDRYGRLVD